MTDCFYGGGADLIVERIDAAGAIHEQDHRNRQFASAEVIDPLLHAVLEDCEVFTLKTADDSAGLFLDGQDIYENEVGVQLERLVI